MTSEQTNMNMSETVDPSALPLQNQETHPTTTTGYEPNQPGQSAALPSRVVRDAICAITIGCTTFLHLLFVNASEGNAQETNDCDTYHQDDADSASLFLLLGHRLVALIDSGMILICRHIVHQPWIHVPVESASKQPSQVAIATPKIDINPIWVHRTEG